MKYATPTEPQMSEAKSVLELNIENGGFWRAGPEILMGAAPPFLPKGFEPYPPKNDVFPPAPMHHRFEFRRFPGHGLDRLPAGLHRAFKLKLKLGMLLHQILEKPKCPGIGGV